MASAAVEISKPNSSFSVKRSWLRAVRRAVAHGKVRYHGQWIRLNRISACDRARACRQSLPSVSVRPSPSPRNVPKVANHSSRKRLRFALLNCGGLPLEKQDAALLWAEQSSIDVLALVETRRRSTATWASGAYKIIHCGEPDSVGQAYSGVLLAIRGCESVRFEECMPGRLLRVCAQPTLSLTPLEILIAYNKPLPWSGDGESFAASLEVRASFWECLEHVLQSIPKRHGLLLLGDYNCYLPRYSPYVPCSDPSGSTSQDHQEFIAILERHALGLLNMQAGRHGITFQNTTTCSPRTGSRLDLVITRLNMRSHCSLDHILWDSPLTSPSSAGWHAMLAGSLDCKWTSWSKGQPRASRQAAVVLDHAKLRDVQDASHPLHKRYLTLLQDRLSKASCSSSGVYSSASFSSLSTLVLECGFELFSRNKSPKPIPAWATSESRDACSQKWSAFRAMRALSAPKTISNYLHCWRVVAHACASQRYHKKLCRDLRQRWVDSICEQAASAASHHHHSLYSFIRQLSPKSVRTPPGMSRLLHGTCSLQDEHNAFYEHFCSLFKAPCDDEVLQPLCWNWNADADPPTCDSDLMPFIRRMPLLKSVPKNQAVGALWRLAFQVKDVRDIVDELIKSMPASGIPVQFMNGALRLLFKPGKRGTSVDHYRPLVLQCTVGKTILKWAAHRLLLHLRLLLLLHPQYAYLPGRSAEMAINRVASFLTWRKALAGYVQLPASHIMQGRVPPRCSGCLVVSLDLKNAFDKVNRNMLFESLDSYYHLPQDLLGLLRSWHLNPEYLLEFGEQSFSIPTSRGVRQGCTIAPYLWLVYLHFIIEMLIRRHGDFRWLDHITIYADDLILCLPIDAVSDVRGVLDRLVLFLHHLRGFGLDINYQKTQTLFKIVGSHAPALMKKFTYKDGSQTLLKVSEELEMPLSSTLEYLGIKLCWGDSANATLRHRLLRARRAFAMLHRWWRKNALPVNTKVKIYNTMVLPVLTYGLSAVGLTRKGSSLFCTEVFRHLRRITRLPAHISRVSNESLLLKFGLLHPLSKVQLGACRLWRRLSESVSRDLCPAGHLDFYFRHHISEDTCWAQAVRAGYKLIMSKMQRPCPSTSSYEELSAGIALLPREALRERFLLAEFGADALDLPVRSGMPHVEQSSSEVTPFACADCGRAFATFTQLRSHQRHSACTWSRVHVTYDPARDCRSALPTCHWCRTSFKWWYQLAQHISLGQCSSADVRKESVDNGEQLFYHTHLDLQKHCVVCARWFKFPRSLTKHLKSCHRAEYDFGSLSYQQARQDIKKAGWKRMCPYCRTPHSSGNIDAHVLSHCAVLLQRYMARVANPLSSIAETVNEQVHPRLVPLRPVPHGSSGREENSGSLSTRGRSIEGCLGSSDRTISKEAPCRRLRGKQQDPWQRQRERTREREGEGERVQQAQTAPSLAHGHGGRCRPRISSSPAQSSRACSTGATPVHATLLRRDLSSWERPSKGDCPQLDPVQSGLEVYLSSGLVQGQRSTQSALVQDSDGQHYSQNQLPLSEHAACRGRPHLPHRQARVLRGRLECGGRGVAVQARRPSHALAPCDAHPRRDVYPLPCRLHREAQSSQAFERQAQSADRAPHASCAESNDTIRHEVVRVVAQPLRSLSLWRLVDATVRGDRGKVSPLAAAVRAKVYRSRGDS